MCSTGPWSCCGFGEGCGPGLAPAPHGQNTTVWGSTGDPERASPRLFSVRACLCACVRGRVRVSVCLVCQVLRFAASAGWLLPCKRCFAAETAVVVVSPAPMDPSNPLQPPHDAVPSIMCVPLTADSATITCHSIPTELVDAPQFECALVVDCKLEHAVAVLVHACSDTTSCPATPLPRRQAFAAHAKLHQKAVSYDGCRVRALLFRVGVVGCGWVQADHAVDTFGLPPFHAWSCMGTWQPLDELHSCGTTEIVCRGSWGGKVLLFMVRGCWLAQLVAGHAGPRDGYSLTVSFSLCLELRSSLLVVSATMWMRLRLRSVLVDWEGMSLRRVGWWYQVRLFVSHQVPSLSCRALVIWCCCCCCCSCC